MRLSESDYRSVLDVLLAAGAVEGPVPFPAPVLEALQRLIPCDVVAYHERPPGRPALDFTGEPHGDFTHEMRATELRFWHQDGLAPAEGARKISDFLTQREFHRLELYQDVCRPLGIEHTMRLWLDPGDGSRLEFDRLSTDFDERDRAVLDLLLPHLRQFRRRAPGRQPIRSEATGKRLTAREREVIDLIAAGRTNEEVARLLWISPGTVRKHLENAYKKLGVRTRTGAVAALRELYRAGGDAGREPAS